MIAANIMWGLMAPLSKMAMGHQEINSWTLVSFRVIGAAIVFWLVSFFTKKERVPLSDLKLLAVAALLGIIMNQGVFIMGISYTSPINASIVTTTLPIVTMIISAMYLKEPITWRKFGGIIVGASGALLLILSKSSDTSAIDGRQNIIGVGLCLFAQICYATYFVLFKNVISRYHPITLMKWMFLFASVIYLPFNLHQLTQIDYSSIQTNIFIDIAFIVLGGTFISYLLIPIGQKNLRPTVATMYNNVQPIVASVATVFWGLDTFGWESFVAIILVFFGVNLVVRSKAKKVSASHC